MSVPYSILYATLNATFQPPGNTEQWRRYCCSDWSGHPYDPVGGEEWMRMGKEENTVREENKKPTYKTSGIHLVWHHFINSTGVPLSASRQHKLHVLQGFHVKKSVIFQEHYCAILNTFWVATWHVSLSLCFKECSLQGTLVARRLPLLSSVCLQHHKQTSHDKNWTWKWMYLCCVTWLSVPFTHHLDNFITIKYIKIQRQATYSF